LNRKHLTAWAVVAAALLSVAGCGDDDDDDNGPAAATCATTTCGPCEQCVETSGTPACQTTCTATDTCFQNACTPTATLHETALAGQTFASGPEVTAACLGCHADEGQAVLASVHFRWEGPAPKLGDGTGTFGKATSINNFCVSVPSNEGRCVQCHAGYSTPPAAGVPAVIAYETSEPGRVDCLICHADLSKGYMKAPTGFGAAAVNPAPFAGATPPSLGDMLASSARSVGRPSRDNCGFCHFYAGGGDDVKMGDLGSPLADPTPETDVHMGGTQAMACVECHSAPNHQMGGSGVSVPVHEADAQGCESCHGATPHANQTFNGHAGAIACQTCHIPEFSRQVETKMTWNWNHAGYKNCAYPGAPAELVAACNAGVARIANPDGEGFLEYNWQKGSFVKQGDVVPAYRWYDGRAAHLSMQDGFTAAGTEADPVTIAGPVATSADATAKIYPFKEMLGQQPARTDGSHLITPHLFGVNGFWGNRATGEPVVPATVTAEQLTAIWTEVLEAGAKAAGQLPQDGTLAADQWKWVHTRMYMNLNHEIAPKAMALGSSATGSCNACHFGATRFDWGALGYTCADPMNCAQR
jgi:octaheme c-type cytochrome (tetrathionate reductase family)